MGEPWTICGDCMKPIAVKVYPPEGNVGAWWSATCPDRKCGRVTEPDGLFASDTADFPPPTALDNLALILPILARASDDESLPAAIRGHAIDIVAAVRAAQKAVSHG